MSWTRAGLALCCVSACGVETESIATSEVNAPLKIDLATGKVAETNCGATQASFGCAHTNITLDATTFASADTAFTFAQHTLALQVKQLGLGRQGPHYISFDYEMTNPTGQENNVLCVLVKSKQVERRCIGGIAPRGTLAVPFHARKAGFDLEFGFGTMPLARGSSFAVRNVVLFEGAVPVQPSSSAIQLDLRTAQPYQPSCDIPLGCGHSVKVSAGEFAATTVESDSLPGRLALSVGVPDDKTRALRSITFNYTIVGDSSLEVSARVKNRTVIRTIKAAGTGTVELQLPRNAPTPDRIEIAVTPGSVGSQTAITELAIGSFDAPGIPVPRDPFDCRGVERGVATDPCGPEYETYFVTDDSGTRAGQGIRCLSLDGKAFYAEGWWVASDLGQYRAIGTLRPDGTGRVQDLGVRRLLSTDGDHRVTTDLGTTGVRSFTIAPTGPRRFYASSADGAIDETWELVPKDRALPECYVPVHDPEVYFGVWDGDCGSFGAVSYDALGMTSPAAARKQCSMPGEGEVTVAGVSLPAVWFGRGRVGSARLYLFQHLGWRARTGVDFAFRAANLCLPNDHPDACPRSMDNIDIQLKHGQITPMPPDYDFLVVLGPDEWAQANLDAVSWFGLVWLARPGLPGGASLPPPTPVCPPAGCE